MKIERTKIIYQFDPLHAQNPHEYIDDMPSYCMVLQLSNSYLIAAYSDLPLSKEITN